MGISFLIRGARRSTYFYALTAGALLLSIDSTGAAAQEPEDEDAKNERIASTYRLTEPVLKKYTAAMREMRALARKNPAVLPTDENDEKKKLHPEVRAIFARAGLTEEEVEKFGIAVAYAGMASMGASMSGESARELEKTTPIFRANVAFLKTHETALKVLGEEMKALEAIQEGKSETSVEPQSSTEMKVTGALKGGLNSEIDLEVTGGRHAGRYTAKVSEGGCSYGLTTKGAWGNQYSVNTSDPKKFSSLQLIVPNADAAAGGTEEFMLMVSFGSLLGGTHYKVETSGRRTDGSGTVKLNDSGAGATIAFEGKTKDGVGLKGTIRCHSVMRLIPS